MIISAATAVYLGLWAVKQFLVSGTAYDSKDLVRVNGRWRSADHDY